MNKLLAILLFASLGVAGIGCGGTEAEVDEPETATSSNAVTTREVADILARMQVGDRWALKVQSNGALGFTTNVPPPPPSQAAVCTGGGMAFVTCAKNYVDAHGCIKVCRHPGGGYEGHPC